MYFLSIIDMDSDYDENLRENIFFIEILKKHLDLIKKAAKDNWIICIPRSGTIESSEIDINTILDQVLVPHEDGILKISQCCSTLSKKKLQVRRNKIIIEDCKFSNDTISILFKETFYDGKDSKYAVWCIDKPLFLDHPCFSEPQVLESLPDCIDFLWVESSGPEVLQQIQNLCVKFIESTPNYESEHVQSQKDLIGNLYSRCLQKSLRNATVRLKAEENDQFLDKLKLAVETYMQYCLGRKILFGICTFLVDDDTHMNKIIKKCEGIKDKYLGISWKICGVLIDASCELSKLNNTFTILDKVNCLDRTFNILCGNKNTSSCVTSDDLLQMFVSIILKVNIYNWISNLHFIQDFKFCSSSFSDHVNFLLTTLEASLEYLKSEHFLDLLKSSSLKCSKEQEIFKLVRTGNLTALKMFFKSENNNISAEMCHPLCICDKCEHIAKSLLVDKEIRNEREQTLLIYATIFEQTEVIEYLLNNQVNVNAQDDSGKTALHYASEKGFQDIILLLVSDENINVNIQDRNGNTPLHLSSGRAHEHCVKALIYSSPTLKMDIENNSSESPLHLAAKTGFIQIVQILLENSTYNLTEKDIYSVLEKSHNFNVKNYIEQFSVRKVLLTFPFNMMKSIKNNSLRATFGVKPKSEIDIRKLHLLMNSIKNNDIPLAYFYLGFNNTNKDNLPSKCHPLCNCENCKNTEDFEVSIDIKKHSSEKINVNMCNNDGMTPLHVASQYGRGSLLRILLDCGAEVNIQTYNNLYTPLHLSCLFQQIGIVKELVKCNNCEVNTVDSLGNTPLFYACYRNDSRIIEILLRNDADHEIRNNEGYTVWDVCQKQMLYCAFKAIKNNVKYLSVDHTETL